MGAREHADDVRTYILNGVEGDLSLVARQFHRLGGQVKEEDDVFEHPDALVEGAARIVGRVGVLGQEVFPQNLGHLCMCLNLCVWEDSMGRRARRRSGPCAQSIDSRPRTSRV